MRNCVLGNQLRQSEFEKYCTDCPFRPFKYVVFSDASATGCCAHLNVNDEQVCHKQWYVHECGMNSTWRELTAIVFALE